MKSNLTENTSLEDINLINLTEQKLSLLEELYNRALAANEIKILGRLLKINQGLPTNIVDFMKYVKSIDEHFSSTKPPHRFDFIKFLSDEDYRKSEIEYYESIKQRTNVLQIITELPHFAKMAEAIVLNAQILSDLSVRNKLFIDIAKLTNSKSLENVHTILDSWLIEQ